MKKYYLLILVALILGLVLTGCSLLSNISQVPATSQTKVKPEGLGGAQTYDWYLSGDVMPAPPYGSKDEPGSDTASKLIVNQPYGAVEVTITGVMNGLTPNTTYTVYLANGYTPYVDTGWNVTGDWVLNVTIGTSVYPEDTIFLQIGDSIPGSTSLEGSLLYASSLWVIDEGSVVGSAIDFSAYYDPNPTRTVHFWGTIAADGTMSGDWADDPPYTRSGTWVSTDGVAEKTHTGDDWYTGLFTKTVLPFPFTTEVDGSGSWHVNLRDSDFYGPDTYNLSVWINKPGATILISDTFVVVVD